MIQDTFYAIRLGVNAARTPLPKQQQQPRSKVEGAA